MVDAISPWSFPLAMITRKVHILSPQPLVILCSSFSTLLLFPLYDLGCCFFCSPFRGQRGLVKSTSLKNLIPVQLVRAWLALRCGGNRQIDALTDSTQVASIPSSAWVTDQLFIWKNPSRVKVLKVIEDLYISYSTSMPLLCHFRSLEVLVCSSACLMSSNRGGIFAASALNLLCYRVIYSRSWPLSHNRNTSQTACFLAG